ncbi:WD repeat-containing protein 81-like [Babylonia areolata]|uniref:WD repeat-containing protein 81-like n=1 Tax=Babylonia areolata TaxID=304850 RepID=UPI003FD298B3
MDSKQTVAEILRLPVHCCRSLSPDRVVCLVTEEWVKQLYQGQIQPLQTDPSAGAFVAEKYLAQSCSTPVAPWTRLTAKIWPKSQQGMRSLLDSGLTAHPIGKSLVELMGGVSRDNLYNLWQAAQNKFPQAYPHSYQIQNHQQTHQKSAGNVSRQTEVLADQMWHWIWRLSPDVHIYAGKHRDQAKKNEVFSTSHTASSNLHNLLMQNKSKNSHSYSENQEVILHSVTRVRVLVETDTNFVLLQPYVEYSLRDVLSYSPAVLDTCYSKPLFIVYQVLQAMATMHGRGLPLGRISLDTVLLDTDMWVSVLCPQRHALAFLSSSSAASESSLVEQSPADTHASHNVREKGLCSRVRHEGNASQTLAKGKGSVPSQTHSQESAGQFPTHSLAASAHPVRQVVTGYTDEDESVYLKGCQFLQQQGYMSLAQSSITELVNSWVERRISNFQYLLTLNHMAGRRMNDPNNHPVLPWVMDFSHPHDGYRDFTKSKFRLNKGDRQLDFTFGLESSYSNTGSSNHDSDTIPHHVSDVLSDITYYVYKARRMPKSILCSHVRTVWVPHEYPASMQRMHDWTPDECIPEFFTDPQLFQSIHTDLPDLEIPAWCSSTREFVIRHMATLESERVSEQLHHWIDLTFGFKLSGKAAVQAKNVYLQLVDGHQTLRSHGIMQMFSQPHPYRLPLSSRPHLGPLRSLRDLHSRWSEEDSRQDVALEHSFDNIPSQIVNPESASIYLPLNFNPLAELEQCETLLGFKHKTLLQQQEKEPTAPEKVVPNSRQHALVTQDMASFLCLVCELFLAPKLRMQQEVPSLVQRIQNIKSLCADDLSTIPRPFRKAVQILRHNLQLEKSSDPTTEGVEGWKVAFSPVMMGGLPPPSPALWLHPLSEVLPFPSYFPSLYLCLCHLKATDEAMQEVKRGPESPAEKAAMLKQLARSKVPVMEQFLLRWGVDLGKEGLQLVLPLTDSLLADKLTMVQAAWQLFNILSRALGPTRTLSTFLPALSVLFADSPATAKHIKLYHRTYLIQLLLRLHLQPFLHHFATLLVEAVAGYKDFLLPSQYYNQELLEELDTAERDGQWVTSDNTEVVLAEEVREEEEEGVGSEGGMDDEDREEFLDTMSLDEENAAAIDAPDHASQTDRSSVGDVSQGSGVGENNEDGVFESDRCSIHSISNILCLSGGRQSTTQDEDEDKVCDSPRDGEGTLSSVTSASSLGQLACNSPTHGADAHTTTSAKRLVSSRPGSGGSSPKPGMDKNGVQSQKNKPSKPLYINTSDLASRASAAEAGNGKTDDNDEGDGCTQSKRKVSDNMKRSETEDLMSTLTLNSPTSAVNIRHIAADSVKWLATKLGPVLAARYLSRNLVRMLPLCYLGESQLCAIEERELAVVKTSRCIQGDNNAHKVLECIGFVASLYGENIILIQYLPSIVDMINVAQRRFTQRSESGLIAAVILMRFVVPLLSDKTLMDVLEDTVVGECITPVLTLLTSTTVSFPSGATCRLLLCHKVVDLLYVLGLRLGLEMTRRFLHSPMLLLMEAFSTVHGAPEPTADPASISPVVGSSNSDESYLTIKKDSLTNQYMIGTPITVSSLNNTPGARSGSPGSNMNRWHSLAAMGTVDEREECLSPRPSQDTEEKCLRELASVFTPELALAAYIPLCRIFGSIFMEGCLENDDLIRKLCAQQDSTMDQPPITVAPDHRVDEGDSLTPDMDSNSSSMVMGGLGSNVEVVGNRIQLSNVQADRAPSPSPSLIPFGRGYCHDGILHITHEEVRSHDMEMNKRRHLRGNWLQYWEHELGLHERDTLFNFKQIKLQSFIGHTNSIRCIVPMDTENCFISASKDKTVRLWALTSCGDGTSKLPCQWTYQHHKKSVFSVAYVESMRQVASCDSTVHVWDPYTGVSLCQLESTRYCPAVALQPLPAPSPMVLMGTTEATLRFLDLRTCKYGHEFRCSAGSLGLLRCVGVCPEGSWVAVGFSTGVISILELDSGLLLSSWKAHDGEILQLKAFNKHKLVSSSFDGTLKVWSVDGGMEICPLKGPSDPVHCFSFYREQVLSATTANRIGVHSSVSDHAQFSSVKLRSDTFKGVLTSMAVLPLNRALLLGSDNGTIQLLA